MSVGCLISHWAYKPDKETLNGAQIDLLLDREDDAITICEIKYSSEPFVLDKSYAKVLLNKLEAFETQQKKTKQVFLILITPFGLKKNAWSEELIHDTIVLEDLFD